MAISEVRRQPPVQGEITAWSGMRRAVFRFAFAYLVLYNMPFPLNAVAGVPPLFRALRNAVTVTIGRLVLHRTMDVAPGGSGDTTADWIWMCCCLVPALLAAGIWTLLDRKRAHYDRLYDGLRIYVRFALAAAMIAYGAMKVFPDQFPAPSLHRLMQRFGDASPMGLLWTFMGASPAYGVFAGLIEMLGGLLLTTRRTTLLGALVCIAALGNVVALNFCYDVPAKLYSVHLLLMAAFLASADLKRLTDFFIRGRAVEPRALRPFFQNRRLDRAARVLRTVFVAAYVGMSLWQSHQNSGWYREAERTPLYGIWAVDEWDVDGVAQPPLVTDASQWRWIVFDRPESLSVQRMSGAWQNYEVTSSSAAHTLTLTGDAPAQSTTLIYTQPAPERLILSGTLAGRRIRIRLRHEDSGQFLLIRRGFHWVNEAPYNR